MHLIVGFGKLYFPRQRGSNGGISTIVVPDQHKGVAGKPTGKRCL